ncbi:hypothetical protein L7F22_050120 [Adiantum nelumboides]|nr:hypothetical protein [Adiantum nelumboides]
MSDADDTSSADEELASKRANIRDWETELKQAKKKIQELSGVRTKMPGKGKTRCTHSREDTHSTNEFVKCECCERRGHFWDECQLILDKQKKFRWDRLASFARIAQQHTQKRMALETGAEVKLVPISDGKVVNPELIQVLANLLLSEKGTIFRQLILEADTFDLARVYNSREAAALRRILATAMAHAFCEHGQKSLEVNARINLQGPRSLAPPSETRDVVNDTLIDDFQTLTDYSSTFDISLLKSEHLQFLLQVAVARLKQRPLLLMQTGWTSFTIVCYAVAVAAHNLVVAICFKMLKLHSDNSPSLAIC